MQCCLQHLNSLSGGEYKLFCVPGQPSYLDVITGMCMKMMLYPRTAFLGRCMEMVLYLYTAFLVRFTETVLHL